MFNYKSYVVLHKSYVWLRQIIVVYYIYVKIWISEKGIGFYEQCTLFVAHLTGFDIFK